MWVDVRDDTDDTEIEFNVNVTNPMTIDVEPDIHTSRELELTPMEPVSQDYSRLNQDDPAQGQDDHFLLHPDLQSESLRKRLDQAIKISGFSTSIEMIFGIVICAYYGNQAFFLIGSIIYCSLRVVFASDVLYTYTKHPALRRSSASVIATLCILSLLDIAFTSIFFNSFEDIATTGIAACSKYSFTSPGSTNYAGDFQYFRNAQQCASTSGKLWWECYCYNSEDHDCYSFGATEAETSDATAACGSYIHAQPVFSSTLSIIVLVLSVIHCTWYLSCIGYISVVSLVKQYF
eukprot:gene17643-20339_t